MPIYEYRCAACGKRFESLVPRHDAEVPPCPGCGSVGVERLLSLFSVTQPGAPAGAPPVAGPCGSPDCACRRAS